MEWETVLTARSLVNAGRQMNIAGYEIDPPCCVLRRDESPKAKLATKSTDGAKSIRLVFSFLCFLWLFPPEIRFGCGSAAREFLTDERPKGNPSSTRSNLGPCCERAPVSGRLDPA